MRPGTRRVTSLATIIVAVTLGSNAAAEDLSRVVTVQGMVETSGGVPATGEYPMTFEIFDAATGGTSIYKQDVASVTVQSGMFDVELGPLPTTAIEADGELWLETTVQGEILTRQPLRAVVYSLVAQRANRAAVADDLDCPGCITALQLGDGAVAGSHIQSGAVTADKVSFAYASANEPNGGANELDCDGCVMSGHLADNLSLEGDLQVAGSVKACTSGAAGCGLVTGTSGIYAHSDGWLHVQSASGVRVRTETDSAYAPIAVGGGTSYGKFTVTGGTLVASDDMGVGTASPAAKLSVAGGVQLGMDSGTCNGAKSGTLRWTGTVLQLCNGSSWSLISSPACSTSGCDDGNKCTTDVCDPNSGCSNTPITPCCGNGSKESGEECDDGNGTNGDGCDSTCKLEGVVTCYNGSKTDCNVPGSTLIASSKFVDQNPPSGWVQCGGFVNTVGDDVANNFMDGCIGTNKIRVRVWNINSGALEEDVTGTGLTGCTTAWQSWNYLGGSVTKSKYTFWTGSTTYFTTTGGGSACYFNGNSTDAPNGTFTFGTGNGGSAIIAPGHTNAFEWRVNCNGTSIVDRKIAVYR